jgi:hypothetical protein
MKSEKGKSEKKRMIKAGINMYRKLMNTIPRAGIFGNLYLSTLAFTA